MNDLDRLSGQLKSLSDAIDACLEKKLHTPALILLYSAIDIMGSLANDKPGAPTRETFTNWVKSYLLPVRMLYCNDIDLYGARCGLVHTFAPDSDLSGKGKARKLAYAWGIGDAERLQRVIVQSGRQDELVAVHFDDLCHGWRTGVGRFLEELEKDSPRRARVLQRASQFFVDVPIDKDHNVILR